MSCSPNILLNPQSEFTKTAPVFVKRDGEKIFSAAQGGDFFLFCSGYISIIIYFKSFSPYYSCCISVTFGKLPNSSSSPVRCEGQHFVTWWQCEPVRPWPCAAFTEQGQVRRLLARAEVLNNTSPAGTVSAEAGVLCEGDPPLAKRSLSIA